MTENDERAKQLSAEFKGFVENYNQGYMTVDELLLSTILASNFEGAPAGRFGILKPNLIMPSSINKDLV